MGFKQAIVVRSDLGMGKGKVAAQASHACLAAYKKASAHARGKWEAGGSEKIVLKVGSERELAEVFEAGRRAKLPCVLVKDAGRTQIPSGTATAVAVGPALEAEVDAITGKLKLL